MFGAGAIMVAAALLAPAAAGDKPVVVDVFDLTIETTHTYFAGGVLAHNY
jgi:intein/homing endonuclease